MVILIEGPRHHKTQLRHRITVLYVKVNGRSLLNISVFINCELYVGVSQPPGRSPVPGPGINYTGPREVLLEFVILVF